MHAFGSRERGCQLEAHAMNTLALIRAQILKAQRLQQDSARQCEKGLGSDLLIAPRLDRRPLGGAFFVALV